MVLALVFGQFFNKLRRSAPGAMDRRKVVMILLFVPFAAFFLLWSWPETEVPHRSQLSGANYKSYMILLYFSYFFFSIFHNMLSVAHSAIGAELAGESRTRDKIYRRETFIEILGILLAVTLPGILHKAFVSCDCLNCTDQNDVVDLLCQVDCVNACNNTLVKQAFLFSCLAVVVPQFFTLVVYLWHYEERAESYKVFPLDMLGAFN